MDSKTSNQNEVTDAIQQVLNGNVNAYELIHNDCDRTLRAFIGARYGHLGDDFIEEVAIRTHERVLSQLDKLNPNKGASFQTWMNWQARSVARQVIEEWYGVRRVKDKKGKRRDVPRFEAFEEEVHAQYVPVVSDLEKVRDKEDDSRVLWQEYQFLAEQGRLSIACHDLEGRTFAQTARRLGVSVSRVRRERERALAVLRRRLQERGVRPCERDSTPAPIIRVYGQSCGEDDDWCASVTANLPDGPDTLAGAAAKDEREEVEPTE